MDYFHCYLSDCQAETWLILLESIRHQFWTGQMKMAWWNASVNGRKRWKFYSEVHSMLPAMESSANMSSIGPEKQEWSGWTNEKLKERSLMPKGTTLQGILNFSKNISHLNPMLWLWLWNSRDCSRVPWVWRISIPKPLDWWRKENIQRGDI